MRLSMLARIYTETPCNAMLNAGVDVFSIYHSNILEKQRMVLISYASLPKLSHVSPPALS